MSYAKTKDEWWEIVNNNWKNLKQIILNYYPNQKDFPQGGYDIDQSFKGAYAVQVACNHVIKEIQAKGKNKLNKEELLEYIDVLRKHKDSDLDKVFQDTWFGMPETESVRFKPGFQIFCDLCSESYVLYD